MDPRRQVSNCVLPA